MTKLTPKQKRFCEEYLIDLNATQAAIRAGYSKKTAYSQGQRLLKNVEVAASIKVKLGERSIRTGITADWVLHQLWNLANGNILDFITIGRDGLPVVNLSNTTRDQTAALRGLKATVVASGGVSVDLKLADKKAALELLGKHLGMFNQKHEISGPDGGPIEVASAGSLDLARRIAFILTTAQRQVKGC